MPTIAELLESGRASTAEALNAFDQLQPVPRDFMIGRWRGSGLSTGHSMDGLLEHYGWYGKEFVDVENVHPLLFARADGNTAKLEPGPLFAALGLSQSIVRSPIMATLFVRTQFLLRTQKSRARLRMTEYRGKLTATMLYDNLPINDVFAKIDEATVLGVMDLKGMKLPFFFVLRRE